ncbi:MAG: ribbon-helix-helix domain-containing protein [Alphaproteobacteria bacterium]|nr:ribbon-helix-helix domain-containing protein [Alphaproteobacteria bacterium]
MNPQANAKASLGHSQQGPVVDLFSNKQDKSSLVSRNVTIGSHRTSIRLEPDMWNGLREICRREHVSMHEIATVVFERKSSNTSLTAAIRVFVMAYFRMAATEEGRNHAGHGPGGAFMNSLTTKRSEEQDNHVSLLGGGMRTIGR